MSKRDDVSRKQLTPRRVVAVCMLVLALLALNELERLSVWFGDHCIEWMPDAEGWCSKPEQLVFSSNTRGFSSQLLAMQSSLLAFTRDLPIVAESRPESVNVATVQPSTPLTPQPPAQVVPPPQATAVTAPATTEPSTLQPTKVLIVGDSMVLEGFGIALQRRLTRFEGLSVTREGKYSTGLTRPDYFDWPSHLTALLDEHRPDLLIVNMGANDPQDIVEQGKRYHVGDQGWNAIYSERVNHFLSIAAERGVTTFWVGLPIMGQSKYSGKIETINQLVADTCAQQPMARYFDTWSVLATDDGEYASFLKNAQGQKIRVRAKDEIHLTEAGGEIMTSYFLTATKPYVSWSEL
ncbi:MAG: DUF459 domain-containing protein [Thiothrix sp.]